MKSTATGAAADGDGGNPNGLDARSDYSWSVADPGGYIAVGIDNDGTFNAARAWVGTLSVGSLTLSADPVLPEQAATKRYVDNARFAYAAQGLVADGRDTVYRCTWAQNSRGVQVVSLHAVVSVAADGRTVSIASNTTGRAFVPGEEGMKLAFLGIGPGGADVVVTIQAVATADTIVVAEPLAAGLFPATAIDLIWPCFEPEDVGKAIMGEGWTDSGFSPTAGVASHAASIWRNFQNFGQAMPLLTTIASVEGPGSITVADPLTAVAQADLPLRVVWGTDNCAQFTADGMTAVEQGFRDYLMPVGMVFLPGLAPVDGNQTNHYPRAGEVIARMRLLGDPGATMVLLDAAGFDVRWVVSPVNARHAPQATRRIVAQRHWRSSNDLPARKVVITGDSYWLPVFWNGRAQTADNSVVQEFKQALRRDNPGVRYTFEFIPQGGATWYETYNNVAALPDPSAHVVVLGNSGNNDWFGVSLSKLEATLNVVRGWTGVNPAGPDPVLVTGAYKSPRSLYLVGGGSVSTPGVTGAAGLGFEVGAVLHRTYANWAGIACLDRESVTSQVMIGHANELSALKRSPNPPAQVCGPESPLNLGRRVRRYSLGLALPGTDPLAAMEAVGNSLRFQIGSRPDNFIRVFLGPNNNLWVEGWAWRLTGGGTASIASGSAELSTGGVSSWRPAGDGFYTAGNSGNVLTSYHGPFPFAGGSSPMVLLPVNGPGNTPFRSQLRVPANYRGYQVWMADGCGGRALRSAETIKYGGTLFQADDARARVDFQIASGGRLHTTRIEAFTDEQRVSLADPWPHESLSDAPVETVIGRRFLAPTDTGFDLATRFGRNCVLDVTVFNDEVAIGFATDGAQEHEVWSGPVIRYGWEFVPQVWPGAACTLTPFTFWKDEIIVCGQSVAPDDIIPQPSASNDPPWAGFAGAHPTTRHIAAVDRVLHAANHYSH